MNNILIGFNINKATITFLSVIALKNDINLFGFILSIWVVSNLSKKLSQDSIFQLTGLIFISNLLVFIPGILYLSSFIGFWQAFSFGCVTFIISGGFKTIILVSVLYLIVKKINYIMIKFRPHHFLCTYCFIGAGYNLEFIQTAKI
jgi:hypothetical protein